MDKRRRNRIQGSWASQARIKSTPKQADKPEDKQEENSKTQAQTQQKFVFQADVVNKTKRAPPERIITKEGSHELSTGPTGKSVIEFVPSFFSKEEKEWMFEQLEADIPWEEKKIKIKEEKKGGLQGGYQGSLYYNCTIILCLLPSSPNLVFHVCIQDWHSDDEPSLGSQPVIASLSFGDTRNFELRKKPPQGEDFSVVQHIRIPLPNGSLLIMKGATQDDWQHRVPKEYHHRDPRINLTFRNILPSESQKTL
ncbi:alpha-ketoglutarate-dependent dioxygenase alkB homolog 3-like [Actinia tenebrosa]|uniref:Alpha-ketoglutarate-dependent dioxygenase alkB homolog 3-like n=1 Tax=Actinia tenebrosa TaxID=6105 RepID=A0A6P8IGL7_ACTTE|nr:alpha-ketoglutarate-dependent dioxygenase alkB homolog 3-like [Actinia tenebrosa]